MAAFEIYVTKYSFVDKYNFIDFQSIKDIHWLLVVFTYYMWTLFRISNFFYIRIICDPIIFFDNSMNCRPFYLFKNRSSRPEVFCKKYLKMFTKFTGKHLCQSFFFNKIVGLRFATLLNERLWHRHFLVNFAKFLRTPFSIEHHWWLLL